MSETFGVFALIAAALFAGAAVYINVSEQPARLPLAPSELLTEWKTAYKRGAALQAPLAIIGGAFGLLAYWRAPHLGFAIGAAAMLANWPWTLMAIRPLNKRLMALPPADATEQTRRSISDWGRLHGVRSGLSLGAVAAFAWALLAA